MFSNTANISFNIITTTGIAKQFTRSISHHCKLLIVGGGSGGVSLAAKFAKICKKDEIIVIEPSKLHYYQPMFTLIGGGLKNYEQSHRQTQTLIPAKVKWLQNKVTEFNPDSNNVITDNGDQISYDFMLVGMGLTLNYNKIPGCEEALNNTNSGVCSIYSPKYVSNVYPTLEKFTSGNAFFTFPKSPVKCPGAPQKICYLAEHLFRKKNVRDKANIFYVTSLPVIFGVEKYAKSLWQVAADRNITVQTNRHLVEIISNKKQAVFENVDGTNRTTEKYSVLHVTPPQSTPPALQSAKLLVNDAGFLDVSKDNLQHVKYKNIFGIGDCTNTPNSKTVAAVAGQCGVVFKHLKAAMEGKSDTSKYDGYASCPLVTGYGKCIMAEFDYNLQPKETFPIDQSKERWTMYLMKKEVLPPLYWHMMLKGYWNGPGFYRKLLHLGLVN